MTRYLCLTHVVFRNSWVLVLCALKLALVKVSECVHALLHRLERPALVRVHSVAVLAVLPLVLLEQAEVQQALVVADALAPKQRLRLDQLDALPAPVLHRFPQRCHH